MWDIREMSQITQLRPCAARIFSCFILDSLGRGQKNVGTVAAETGQFTAVKRGKVQLLYRNLGDLGDL